MASVVDLGSSILGSLFGNKRRSRSTTSKTSKVVKGATRAASEHADVKRAEDALTELSRDMLDLDGELRSEIHKIADQYDVQNLELEELAVPARKSDLRVADTMLVWTPWQIDQHGAATPLF